LPESEEGGEVPQIRFTSQENMMLSQIEDINDNLNRKIQKDMSSKRNAVNIAFFDVS
jgi:hypothetical protein